MNITTTTDQPTSTEEMPAEGTDPNRKEVNMSTTTTTTTEPIDSFDAAWHALRNLAADATEQDRLALLDTMARKATSASMAQTVAEATVAIGARVERSGVEITLHIRRIDGMLMRSIYLASGKSTADYDAASIGRIKAALPAEVLALHSANYWSLANRAFRFTTPNTVRDGILAREAIESADGEEAVAAAKAAAPTAISADALTAWAEHRASGGQSGSNRGGSATVADAEAKAAKATEHRAEAVKATEAIVETLRSAEVKGNAKVKAADVAGLLTKASVLKASDDAIAATIAILHAEQARRKADAKAKADADAAKVKATEAAAKAAKILADAEAKAAKIKADAEAKAATV